MVTLYTDRELASGYVQDIKFQEMYTDTDVFYKLFYLLHQFGLEKYFTCEVDQNGRGVYIRICKKESENNVIQ